ncbi:MAG: glycosyltransferase [Longimicrobiales bacterium]
MSRLSVLSFGFTRGLWEGDSAEDVQRLRQYAERLDDYIVVANSYKRHCLAPLKLAANFEAIPTNALCFVDSFLRMLLIGWRVLRSRRISLIQAQDPMYTGLVAMLLARCFGQPVNVCVYGPNPFDPHWLACHWSHPLLGVLGRWVLRRSRGIQVDGQMTARSLIAAGFALSRVHVKPNVPMNLERFLAIRREPGAQPRPVQLLFVGRLAPQKNLTMLIAAIAALKTRVRTEFELQLFGDGPEEGPLRAEVARRGLSSCCRFRAAVSRDDIPAVYAAADVFLLSSHYEGYPRVLMEAAAAELPIVSTAVSGADEAVATGETGFLVPVGDLGQFVERVALLVDDASLRTLMGRAARCHIRFKLDPKANVGSQADIWQAIAGTAAVSIERTLPTPLAQS